MASKYVAEQLREAASQLKPDSKLRVPEIPVDLQDYLDTWITPVLNDAAAYEEGRMSVRKFKERNWG